MSLRLGLIGHPVSHSLSPPMHRAALSYFGFSGSYELIDLDPSQYTVEELGKQIRTQLSQFSGFNVTIPHKQLVYTLVDERSPEAELLCAVNTVRVDSAGRLLGFNTDLPGFISALRLNCCSEVQMERLLHSVLVLGAGGAARAAIAGLLLSGARRLVIAVRNPAVTEQCQHLASKVSAFNRTECQIQVTEFSELPSISSQWKDENPPFSLVVNCTSLGLSSNDQDPFWSKYVFPEWSSPVVAANCDPLSLSGAGLKSVSLNTGAPFFFDTVYRKDRSPTLLMKIASARDFSTCDGLSMLIEQARFAFEIWSGRRINAEYIWDALK